MLIKRRCLCVRVRTRKREITKAEMHSVKQDYYRCIMTSFNTHIRDIHNRINKDETAVYLNGAPSRTVHQEGEKTVAVMIGGTSS